MAFLFDTTDEYDEEITFMRTQMRNAMSAQEFQLDTSQSRQKVVMNPKELRLYLTQLVAERQALVERGVGASVTSITYRRCY